MCACVFLCTIFMICELWLWLSDHTNQCSVRLLAVDSRHPIFNSSPIRMCLCVSVFYRKMNIMRWMQLNQLSNWFLSSEWPRFFLQFLIFLFTVHCSINDIHLPFSCLAVLSIVDCNFALNTKPMLNILLFHSKISRIVVFSQKPLARYFSFLIPFWKDTKSEKKNNKKREKCAIYK